MLPLSYLLAVAIAFSPPTHPLPAQFLLAGKSWPAGEQCYQKLLYRICEDDQGHWRIDPSPALPMPGPPAPPAPNDQNGIA